MIHQNGQCLNNADIVSSALISHMAVEVWLDFLTILTISAGYEDQRDHV